MTTTGKTRKTTTTTTIAPEAPVVKKEETFLDRLKKESFELTEKLEKLQAFLRTSKFEELDTENRALLRRQCQVMAEYSEILSKRLTILQRK
jgi:hypothetical protein